MKFEQILGLVKRLATWSQNWRKNVSIYVLRPYGHQIYINSERHILYVHIDTKFRKYDHVNYWLIYDIYLIFYVRLMAIKPQNWQKKFKNFLFYKSKNYNKLTSFQLLKSLIYSVSIWPRNVYGHILASVLCLYDKMLSQTPNFSLL